MRNSEFHLPMIINKRVHLSLIAILLSVNFVYAQSLSTEQWREDLRYLAVELPRRHINLFHSLSPEDFNNAVAELDSDIPTLPDHAIIMRMARILTMAKEGHTYLEWSNPTRTMPFSRLPVRFLAFKDGLYVTEAAPFDVVTNRGRVNYARAIGARVVRKCTVRLLNKGLSPLAIQHLHLVLIVTRAGDRRCGNGLLDASKIC